MDQIITTKILTHNAVLAMLQAGAAKAEEIGQPQCMVVVDASGQILGELMMTGAKFLSRKSAKAKALTASSIRNSSANIPEDFGTLIASATQGNVTRLPGGLPIQVSGEHLGGIGIGSGTGDQDIAVANAMLAAIGADIPG